MRQVHIVIYKIYEEQPDLRFKVFSSKEAAVKFRREIKQRYSSYYFSAQAQVISRSIIQ